MACQSVDKTTQAPSLAVPCACHLLACSRESPPKTAPAEKRGTPLLFSNYGSYQRLTQRRKAKLPPSRVSRPRLGLRLSPSLAQKRREKPRRSANVTY